MARRRDVFEQTGIDAPELDNFQEPEAEGPSMLQSQAPDYGAPQLIPEYGNSIAGRGGLSPRESFDEVPHGGGGSARRRDTQAAPSRPSRPESMAGTTFEAPTPQGPGVLPFNDAGAPPLGGSNLAMSRLFGRRGGLQGGGLGVPLDPVADEASDPISTLLMLLANRGR